MQINFNVFLIEKKKFDSDVLVKYCKSDSLFEQMIEIFST